MTTSSDINWMTFVFIIYEQLIMQLKFENETVNF